MLISCLRIVDALNFIKVSIAFVKFINFAIQNERRKTFSTSYQHKKKEMLNNVKKDWREINEGKASKEMK